MVEQPGPLATGASLARRLRELRRSYFPDAKITQLQLAQALSKDEPVADSTLSSWENVKAPTLPPQSRSAPTLSSLPRSARWRGRLTLCRSKG
jgi:hypothetical protein